MTYSYYSSKTTKTRNRTKVILHKKDSYYVLLYYNHVLLTCVWLLVLSNCKRCVPQVVWKWHAVGDDGGLQGNHWLVFCQCLRDRRVNSEQRAQSAQPWWVPGVRM